jgi:S1-C subfamily serine protease
MFFFINVHGCMPFQMLSFVIMELMFEYLNLGLHSSLYSGVVSKVVQIPANQLSHLARAEADNMDIPVMLQTTAAVHPGASGGVLVNTHGLMVGIITRYKIEPF